MKVKILLVGDSAISVQLGEDISLDVNQLVRRLYAELEKEPITGIVEMVPTYASLFIQYQPEVIGFEQLNKELNKRVEHMGQIELGKQIVKEIPICYEGELAPDLNLCAELENVSTEELIKMHSSHEYYCYMLGFAPGHAYMARFFEAFHFKRREKPRVKIAERSIVAQENLSNLIPFEQPCGWNIIGSTPLTICDYNRESPFLVHSGEWVKYVRVNRREYDSIRKDDLRGIYRVRTYEKVVS